jgi:hypothetical protein
MATPGANRRGRTQTSALSASASAETELAYAMRGL